jgi:LacI family transcriptional regulator
MKLPESMRRRRRGKSAVIAYVGADRWNPCLADVMHGIEAAARPAGALVLVGNTGGREDRERFHLDVLSAQHVHGILITPAGKDLHRVADLRLGGTSVVLVEADVEDDEFCAVTVDHVLGGRRAMEHLLHAGHRRLAFAGDPSSSSHERDQYRGAVQALEAAQGDPDDLVVLESRSVWDGNAVDAGRSAGERLAGVPISKRPTAVICGTDRVAVGVLQALIRRGVSVPDDVAIVGYGDQDVAEVASVPLTSVHPPRQALGVRRSDCFSRRSPRTAIMFIRRLPCRRGSSLVLRPLTVVSPKPVPQAGGTGENPGAVRPVLRG